MRARRLVAVVSAAALGVVSLAACGKSAPDTAAYVGDATYSIERVDAVFDDAQAKYGDAVRGQIEQTGATPSPDQLRSGVTRQDVVNLLVSLELGKRVAAAKQIQVPDNVSAEQLQQVLQMPAAAEYVTLAAEWFDVYSALAEKLPPAELSDDAVMAVYQALVKAGAINPGLSVDQVREAFGEGAFVRTASAVSATLQDEAERAGTSINPRFRPVAVPAVVSTSEGPVFYALPYIDQDGPVTDISTPGTATLAP